MPDLDQLLDTLVTDVGARTRAPGASTAIKQAHRRRTKAAAAVAVVVAAATAAVIAGSAVTITDRTAPPLEQPEETKNVVLTRPLVAPESLLDVRELGFHVEPVEGVEVLGSWGITSDGHQVHVEVDHRWAVVEVHYQGMPLRPMTGTGEDVTVNGLPGTYTEAVSSDGYAARLAWRYAPDSWAEVGISGDGEPPPDLQQQYLTVAEAVRPGGIPLRVPVRFGSAPASLPPIAEPNRVDLLGNEGGWTLYVRLNDDVMVSATSAIAPDECLEFTYRGHRGCAGPNDAGGTTVGLHLGDADVTYEFGPSTELPLEDIKRQLAGVTVASTPFDMATWFDLKTALGG